MLRKPLAFSLGKMSNRLKRGAGVINYSNPERVKSHIFSQEQYFFSEEELGTILTPRYRAALLFNEKPTIAARKLSAQEEQALFDIQYYLKDDLLVKVDIASMQFSLEARTPFLDYRIVEFALNLSENLKKKGDVSKYLLKEVLYDYVPAVFFDRPKWGFSIPMIKWLKRELHYLIDQNLSTEVVSKCGIVNYEAVKELIKRFEAGEDYLYNRIWALILLHKWIVEHGYF
jgi:asparagine synthase (glutamine-hydrolysing)